MSQTSYSTHRQKAAASAIVLSRLPIERTEAICRFAPAPASSFEEMWLSPNPQLLILSMQG